MTALIKVFIVVFLILVLIPMLFVIAGELGLASLFAGSDFGYILLTVVFIVLTIIFLLKAFC